MTHTNPSHRSKASRRALLLSTALACAGASGWAQAQTQSPIKILVGAPAGGTTDTMARTLATVLGTQLGRTVVVENKPGAGGNLAADAVAKAAPDGNTLLMSFTSHAINASLYPKLPFDPVKDFTPLTMVSTSPSILVAHPKVAANNVKELITLAKSKPGQLNFAIGAVGSSLHMAGDAFKMQSGVYIVNIPYRGTAPAVQDVLAGQVDLMFAEKALVAEEYPASAHHAEHAQAGHRFEVSDGQEREFALARRTNDGGAQRMLGQRLQTGPQLQGSARIQRAGDFDIGQRGHTAR